MNYENNIFAMTINLLMLSMYLFIYLKYQIFKKRK